VPLMQPVPSQRMYNRVKFIVKES